MTPAFPCRSYFQWIDSPVGSLKLVANDSGLIAILWAEDPPRRVPLDHLEEGRHPVIEEARRQLGEFFAGTRRAFTVSLAPRGTPFQRKVWSVLDRIPFGETRTYGWVATQVGNPAAIRAAGGAIGRNPISIITPCHRVIGRNGTLTGFAGGLRAKEYLLNWEQSQAAGKASAVVSDEIAAIPSTS